MKGFPRWGIMASAVYLVASGALFVFAANCTGFACSGIAILAALPWVGIWQEGVPLDFLGIQAVFTGWPFLWVSVIVNTILIYIIFAFLQRRSQRT